MTTFLRQWERDRAAAWDAADAEYARECKAARYGVETPEIRARYLAAHKAVGERFDAMLREHEAEQERIARKRAAKEARAAEAAEREHEQQQAKARKQIERQRIGDKFEIMQHIAKATTPPTVFMSPQQAAARLNMTMREFWSRVRSGVYPAPRTDDGVYDADTVARLPRPKVQRRPARRAIPDNVLTQIWKF